MKKTLYGLLISASLVMGGCGKQIPDDIIQPYDMERVLYDYHLASGMSINRSDVDKEAYRQYVFQKHRITEAEFDSSMVWYTRNAKELSDIYGKLSKRFESEENRVRLLMGDKVDESIPTEAGDTVDIWKQLDLYWLATTPLNNMIRFQIRSDENFRPKDLIEWKARFTFLSEGKAIMGMNLFFDNDSVVGKTLTITQSGEQVLSLQPDSAYQLQNINGFIHVLGDSIQQPNVLVDRISLMRYHTQTDSLAAEAPGEVIK